MANQNPLIFALIEHVLIDSRMSMIHLAWLVPQSTMWGIYT